MNKTVKWNKKANQNKQKTAKLSHTKTKQIKQK